MKSPYDSRISWIKCKELSLPIDLEQEYRWINVEYPEKDFEWIEGDLEDKNNSIAWMWESLIFEWGIP